MRRHPAASAPLPANVTTGHPGRTVGLAALLAGASWRGWKFCVPGSGAGNGHEDVQDGSFGHNRITGGGTEAATRCPAPAMRAQQAGGTGMR